MGAFLIVAGVALALILANKAKGGGGASSASPDDGQPSTAMQPSQEQPNTLGLPLSKEEIGAIGGVAATGLGALGVPATAIAGIVGAAVAGYVGYKAGEALGEILPLGGDAGRIVLKGGMAALGAGAVLIACFFGVGVFFIAFAAIGVVVVALAAGVAGAIDDSIRLASYGQAGAIKDLQKHRDEMMPKVVEALQTGDQQHAQRTGDPLTLTTPERVNRLAIPMIAGHATLENELNYQKYMTRPWGIGATRLTHAVYGRDRGYFVGDVTETGDLKAGDRYGRFFWGPEEQAQALLGVPPEDRLEEIV